MQPGIRVTSQELLSRVKSSPVRAHLVLAVTA